MRSVVKILKGLLAFYILSITMLYFFQEKLIFLPTTLAKEYRYEFNEPFEEIFLTADDGAVLNAIHFRRENPYGVILYFHGNAGDLSRWGSITEFFARKNYDVVVMDYRTYGKSTGRLSEQALFDDGQLFYDYTSQQYEESVITLYGRSLGTAIAAKLASQNRPKRLILETPYYSLMDVAKDRFPFLPLKWLLKYKLNTYEFIKEVDCPVTIFHGTDDHVVPYESGRRLFDVVPGSHKNMVTIEHGEHNNLIRFDTYLTGIQAVLDTVHSNRSEDK